MFPESVYRQWGEALAELGSCRDDRASTGKGCGRHISEFVKVSEAIEYGAAMLHTSGRLAVVRYRCPCGVQYVAAAELPTEKKSETLVLDGLIEDIKKIAAFPREMDFVPTPVIPERQAITHIAGMPVVVNGRTIQRCALCGAKLCDSEGAAMPLPPDGSAPEFPVWQYNALVSVTTGNPTCHRVVEPEYDGITRLLPKDICLEFA